VSLRAPIAACCSFDKIPEILRPYEANAPKKSALAFGKFKSEVTMMPISDLILRERIMRTASQRDVMFLDVLTENEPEHVPARPLRELMDKIGQLRRATPTAKWYQNNTRKVFIRELQVFDNDDKICLLLYDTDADAPGASFANLDTDEQRNEDKQEREGRPESAHLIIKLASQEDKASRYLAILEESSRLTRSQVQRYFNAILKDIPKHWKGEFSVPHIDGSRMRNGTPRMQSFYPKVDLQGHLSDDFQTDLQMGKLRGIALETSRPDRLDFGEPRSVQARRRDIKLKPVGSWRDEPLRKIHDAIRIGRDQRYENARITFQTQDGTSHVALLDTVTENLVNDGYIKRLRLSDFDHLILEASTSIDTQLRDKMSVLL
jgi:hypothetical protein